MKNIWIWLFGKDEYMNGEHIAHEPSLWQRVRRKNHYSVGMITIEIELT
jgi:hypothetical protein